MDGDARPRRRHHLSGGTVTSADTTGSSGMMISWRMNGVVDHHQEEV